VICEATRKFSTNGPKTNSSILPDCFPFTGNAGQPAKGIGRLCVADAVRNGTEAAAAKTWCRGKGRTVTGNSGFQIRINQFRINLIGQKWMADISYEASLTQNSQLVAREAVTGSAERLKVIGSGGAEK
jgi:hypothetical protein